MDNFYLNILTLIIIPIFGAMKNIIKRKTFNIKIFLRTFVVYFLIYLGFKYMIGYEFEFELLDCMSISLLERYCMFIFKIIYAIITKNYEKKKFKYYKKYLTELSEGSLDKMYQIEQMNQMNHNEQIEQIDQIEQVEFVNKDV
jgi:hypothetical protein